MLDSAVYGHRRQLKNSAHLRCLRFAAAAPLGATHTRYRPALHKTEHQASSKSGARARDFEEPHRLNERFDHVA